MEKNFAASVYSHFFGPVYPVRTIVGAQLLNIDVEIDAIFTLPDTP
jgi:enamine deaminase RidA (YjgF/YER057c/UK114 family)